MKTPRMGAELFIVMTTILFSMPHMFPFAEYYFAIYTPKPYTQIDQYVCHIDQIEYSICMSIE